jgi:hypothetical protein
MSKPAVAGVLCGSPPDAPGSARPLMSMMALVVVSSLRSRKTLLPAAFDGRVGILLLSLWA